MICSNAVLILPQKPLPASLNGETGAKKINHLPSTRNSNKLFALLEVSATQIGALAATVEDEPFQPLIKGTGSSDQEDRQIPPGENDIVYGAKN